MKTYQIEISTSSTAMMFIQAKDEAEAKERAQKLLDEGSGDIQLDTGGGNSSADFVREAENLEPRDKEQAEHNTEVWGELSDGE